MNKSLETINSNSVPYEASLVNESIDNNSNLLDLSKLESNQESTYNFNDRYENRENTHEHQYIKQDSKFLHYLYEKQIDKNINNDINTIRNSFKNTYTYFNAIENPKWNKYNKPEYYQSKIPIDRTPKVSQINVEPFDIRHESTINLSENINGLERHLTKKKLPGLDGLTLINHMTPKNVSINDSLKYIANKKLNVLQLSSLNKLKNEESTIEKDASLLTININDIHAKDTTSFLKKDFTKNSKISNKVSMSTNVTPLRANDREYINSRTSKSPNLRKSSLMNTYMNMYQKPDRSYVDKNIDSDVIDYLSTKKVSRNQFKKIFTSLEFAKFDRKSNLLYQENDNFKNTKFNNYKQYTDRLKNEQYLQKVKVQNVLEMKKQLENNIWSNYYIENINNQIEDASKSFSSYAKIQKENLLKNLDSNIKRIEQSGKQTSQKQSLFKQTVKEEYEGQVDALVHELLEFEHKHGLEVDETNAKKLSINQNFWIKKYDHSTDKSKLHDAKEKIKEYNNQRQDFIMGGVLRNIHF